VLEHGRHSFVCSAGEPAGCGGRRARRRERDDGSAKASVRPLAHVADALAQLGEDAFLAHDLVAVELEPGDERAGERADELRRAGLSTGAIAQGAGLSPQHVWRIETGGIRSPSYDTFSKIERLTETVTKSARPKAT
jgi:hypothetical protein